MTSFAIAFVYPSFEQIGGAENHVLAAARGLAQRGHRVDLFTANVNTTFYPELERDFFQLKRVDGRGFMAGISGTLDYMRKFRQTLKQYDVVIPVNFPAHVWVGLGAPASKRIWLCLEPKRNLYPDVMYAEAPHHRLQDYRHFGAGDYQGRAGLLRIMRDPHVLLPYGLRAMGQRVLDQWATHRVDGIITNSPYTAEKIAAIYPFAQSKIQIGWAGVALPPMNPNPPEKIILVPTRLEIIKNVETVIKAVARLKIDRRLSSYHVVIIGSGSDEARLRALTHQLDATDVIQFTGFVTDQVRDDLYATCAFVVYPPLAEPLGLPPIEAGLHSKAVIAANEGGTAYIVRHNETGLSVPMENVDAVAESIASLIESPDEAARMGRRARAVLEPIMGFPSWIEHFEALVRLHING